MTFKYKWKPSDNLLSLSKQYKLTPEQITRANPGGFPAEAGQTIKIPNNAPPPLPGILGEVRKFINDPLLYGANAIAPTINAYKNFIDKNIFPTSRSTVFFNPGYDYPDSRRADLQSPDLQSPGFQYPTYNSTGGPTGGSKEIIWRYINQFNNYADTLSMTGQMNRDLLPISIGLASMNELNKMGFFDGRTDERGAPLTPAQFMEYFGYSWSNGIWTRQAGSGSGLSFSNQGREGSKTKDSSGGTYIQGEGDQGAYITGGIRGTKWEVVIEKVNGKWIKITRPAGGRGGGRGRGGGGNSNKAPIGTSVLNFRASTG